MVNCARGSHIGTKRSGIERRAGNMIKFKIEKGNKTKLNFCILQQTSCKLSNIILTVDSLVDRC